MDTKTLASMYTFFNEIGTEVRKLVEENNALKKMANDRMVENDKLKAQLDEARKGV